MPCLRRRRSPVLLAVQLFAGCQRAVAAKHTRVTAGDTHYGPQGTPLLGEALRAEVRLQNAVARADRLFFDLVSASPSSGNHRAVVETFAQLAYRDAAEAWRRRGAVVLTALP